MTGTFGGDTRLLTALAQAVGLDPGLVLEIDLTVSHLALPCIRATVLIGANGESVIREFIAAKLDAAWVEKEGR